MGLINTNNHNKQIKGSVWGSPPPRGGGKNSNANPHYTPPTHTHTSAVKSDPALVTDHESVLQVRHWQGKKTQRGRNYSSSFRAGAAEMHSSLTGRDGKMMRCFK